MSNPAVSASEIEVLRPDFPRGEFRAAMFDFDGTLSLIRRNWQAVMIPMMVDMLVETGTSEPREQLHAHVEDFVMRLNGKQTIYQMMQLADEVRARGGEPREPLAYKHQYHDLLWEQVGGRVAALKEGRATAEEMTVPGSRRLLEQLRDRGLKLYLASGTDLKYVRDEVAVLGLEEFFGDHIYGALDDFRSFSKAMIIEHIIKDMNVQGHQLLAFGDGFVEIEETRRAGGVAIGVASDEEARQGINQWKRERLIRAGADIIVGDYRQQDQLLALLGL
ncbi:MAG TPA: HAD family hydrolase [Pirellulales bacterium]|jgi:beta-phosphoglucomutase-like phosphatase (HAD superfamily)